MNAPGERTAFLFPGQGTDAGDLGPGRLGREGPMRELLALASDALHLDLGQALVRRDPIAARTEVAQPATVAVALALALEREAAGPAADALAGHSLGELAAVALAGCLTPEQAIGAAVARGQLMGEAARRSPGTMAAIRCQDEGRVHELLAAGRRHGALDLAAHNAPAQWVLSGDRAALGAVAALTPLSPLPVTGPWHSRAMAGAARSWETLLRQLPWQRPRRLLLLAGTAQPATEATDLPAVLAAQLHRPVLWVETILALRAAGVARFVALEPGRVLRNLCREILGGAAEVVAA